MQGRVGQYGGHLLGVLDAQGKEVQARCGERLGQHEGLGHRPSLRALTFGSGPSGRDRLRLGTTSAGDLVSKVTG
ncbi:hypothetical protein GCM10022232_74440 [Streptomyces plumbiresistens]|uniref:Uncharacterized protein n=1 Tax=Streptomyces plumbiresistens TaxID=511811 RepID=A0ABP7T1A7_9ACTN